MRHVDTIEADLDRLAAALGVERPVPDGRPMTVAELATLAAHPLIDIGVHTDDASPAARPAADRRPARRSTSAPGSSTS